VESSCELGNEPSGSIKYWELPSGCTSCGLSSGNQLHRVSQLVVQLMTKQTRNSVPISLQANYSDRTAAAFGEVSAGFESRGCCVVIATDPHGRLSRFSRPEPLIFFSNSLLSCLQESKWAPFQTPLLLENLVTPGLEHRTSGSVVRNYDD
jgi:hypothetical protein